MLDLDDQIRRVWNPDVRPLIAEAWQCYGIGAYRGAITLTWLAVCEDLAEKVIRLADDGDGVALAARTKIVAARTAGLAPAGIKAMQELERSLLNTAVEIELVDTITARELERLREDRHLCVHPSLRGEVYEPRAETAREHIAAALSGLLTLPATQGRKVVERFTLHVSDPSFTPTSEYLVQTYFDHVRPGVRRSIVELACKHALLELPAIDPPGAQVVAERMAACLLAFNQKDRAVVRDALTKSMDRLRAVDGDGLLRALSRLGELDVFWDVVDAPLALRLTDVVSALPLPDVYGNLAPGQVEVLSLVASPVARDALPALVDKFDSLHPRSKAAVIAQRPSAYFGDSLAALLESAGGWRSAEEIARNAVVPMGQFLTSVQVGDVLAAWVTNDQCRTAGGMLSIAVDFYVATSHLRPGDRAMWQQFVDEAKRLAPEGSTYTYAGLEAQLIT